LFLASIEWYIEFVVFTVELEREDDGRWLAEVPALSGVMCYGADRDEAVARVRALALRVIAERLEHREGPAEFVNVTFQAA
jgi:predicted RNase H-like HicB family nuclease